MTFDFLAENQSAFANAPYLPGSFHSPPFLQRKAQAISSPENSPTLMGYSGKVQGGFDFLAKVIVRLLTHPTYPARFTRHPSFKGRHRRLCRLKTVLSNRYIEGREAQVASQPIKCSKLMGYSGKVSLQMLFSDAKTPNSYILTPNYITPTAGSETPLSTLQAPH